MKLIKIGRANTCNLVLHSSNVSAVHAEILLKDDGQILLEDKNSLNGTFVSGQKIRPNDPVRVTRGDLIQFADTALNWNSIPIHKPKKDEKWINIGSAEDCELSVPSQYVSRYHAILKIKGKKAFIMDNESTNGTIVNGTKIQRNKDIQIKRGDSIICGDTDITDDIKTYLPSHFGWLKPVAIAAAAAAVIVGLYYIIPKSSDYKPAVVYVDAAYHYEIIFEDYPITFTYTPEYPYFSGTAFFVDKNGVLATNRHVACPWEDLDSDEKLKLKGDIDKYISDQFPIKKFTDIDQIETLKETNLGLMVLNQWEKLTNKNAYQLFDDLSTLVNSVINAKYQIKGELDYITVGYPGRFYSNSSQLDICHRLAISDTPDKDVALLQLDDKHTPDKLHKNIIDINKMTFSGKYQPQKEDLTWIGYPRGLGWNRDMKTFSLEPQVRSAKISKAPSLYTFEIEGELKGGASGSPIFNAKTGKIYGIVYAGRNGGTTYGLACKAQYIKELYIANLPVIEQ